MKFMVAKEKIMMTLIRLKEQQSSIPANEFLNNIGSEDGNKYYDVEEGKMLYDLQSMPPDHQYINNDIMKELGIWNEPELMNMYNQSDKVVYKSPGNFDIFNTHQEAKIFEMPSKEYQNPHIQLFFPKRKYIKSVGRPRTRGVFNGSKVSHPSFKNANTRYRRSKRSNLSSDIKSLSIYDSQSSPSQRNNNVSY